jgi:hypothetical protein
MLTMTTRERLAAVDEEILMADGLDEAIVGYAERCGSPPIAVYDRAKCVEIVMEREDLTREEAEAFLEESVIGAWLGDQTPLFLTRL